MALAKQQQEDHDKDTSDDYNSDSEEVGFLVVQRFNLTHI